MSVHNVMTADEIGADLVTFARDTARVLVKAGLTRSQIRNVFTEVRQIEALWRERERRTDAMRRLNMLKPKLFYLADRTRSVKRLRDVLSEAIDQVNQANTDYERELRFQRFVDLFEAILAYHRSEGGRN